MKKILLFLMTICAFVIVKGQTQICGAAAIKRWTNEVVNGNLLPGSQSTTTAPIVIDGSTADWAQYITGPFNYFNQPVPTYQPDPHVAPVADAIGNIQLDALKGEVGERDRPGQEHRDLRYFAFTYDRKNAYFYFRRPGNNSAQVTLYYFIDINVDGFMRTGEPVIKISYNGGQGTLSMAYFVENPGSISGSQAIPGSWVSGKGNAMSATVARTGNNNTSDWVVGSADGWSMPGSTVDVPNSDLPVVDVAGGEKVGGMGLKDTYSDGATSTGYGAEFVIPWSFFRLYGGYSYPGYVPLNYMNVFTWHVSLAGGNSGIEGSEDNAGGCCSGLAVSGSPNVTSSGVFSGTAQWIYRTGITYTEQRNLKTKVTTGNIEIINPKDGGDQPLAAAAVQAWQLTGTADLDCSPATPGVTTTFAYVSTTTDLGGNVHYLFAPNSIANATVLLAANSSGCYYIDINTIFGGFPAMKFATVSYAYTTEFDISSNSCNNISNGGSAGSLDVLPVKMTYFNAARSGQNVNLSWQTSFEENNTGFEIQRFTGAGGWQTIGFVATQATYGNSGIALNYQYTDINTTKGITQYRLKQVDKGNRSAYSVIRSVRGLGQKANTIIYPNPSGDGKVSVVFDDASGIHDVSLMDVSGKTLKQWKGVTNNNIQIDNLNSGFYTVRIVNAETGEQVVEKFIVNKR
ncbi:MAG TPA: T9SS type A sorting domain-containing protein [Chitinophagaceae bacterium]|nr:T9SS type A sorting domain-containing protein [Chitinophagaceae bacterium]